jgi:hypothetical protein
MRVNSAARVFFFPAAAVAESQSQPSHSQASQSQLSQSLGNAVAAAVICITVAGALDFSVKGRAGH